MSVVGIAETGFQDATNAAIGMLSAQMEGVHTATEVVTGALFPPTNDGASARATIQELGNTAAFSAQLRAGLAQMAQQGAVIGANTRAQEAADISTAAASAAISA
ncbi:MAG: hypothetical protein ACJA07_000472 [Rhodococcus sp. (in: high G+C Gram-positive bacteria)]|jgi:hypothetical protein